MPTSLFPDKAFLSALRGSLPPLLPEFLERQRWFGGKARAIRSVEVADVVPFCFDALRSYFVLVTVIYSSGPAETYDIPLIQMSDPSAGGLSCLRFRAGASSEEIVLKDAVTDEQFLAHLLDSIAAGVSVPGITGMIRAVSTLALPALWQPSEGPLTPSVMTAEQSNSSVVYGKRLVLKIFRRVEEGLNPDLEIGAYLTGKSTFQNVPKLAGYLEYVTEDGARTSLGVLQSYVANQGDAWHFTLKALEGYYRQASQPGGFGTVEISPAPLLTLCGRPVPDEAKEYIGSYLHSAALLGRRTAELHLALASATEDLDFAPKPFSETDRKTLVTSGLELLSANFDLLRRLKDGMPSDVRQDAENVLKLEGSARRRFDLLLGVQLSASVTRIHGDYHLGQVLFTGDDFVIVDFEGEPARPLAERRKKRSPLQDVAGMMRSFHYAAYAPLLQANRQTTPEQAPLGRSAQFWQKWVSVTFLKTYLEVAGNAIFIPANREELALLLDLYLLDKAVYELGYELNNRPTWVRIPLDGISQLLRR